MPTASPTMVIMFSTMVSIASTRPIRAVAPRAMTIANAARTSGTPAATTAPKTSTRTTKATGTPINSAVRRSFCATAFHSLLRLPSPLVSTVKPSRPLYSFKSLTRGTTLVADSSAGAFMFTGKTVV